MLQQYHSQTTQSKIKISMPSIQIFALNYTPLLVNRQKIARRPIFCQIIVAPGHRAIMPLSHQMRLNIYWT